MSSLPGGDSRGRAESMVWSSSRSGVVWSSSMVRDFGRASWRDGVPMGRIAEEIARVVWSLGRVTVIISSGVGGANPPVMPVIC